MIAKTSLRSVGTLQSELHAAGIPFAYATVAAAPGEDEIIEGELVLHAADGSVIPSDSPEVAAVVAAHVPVLKPVAPDFGTDEPSSDFYAQAAQVVQQFRAYLSLAAPTAAQSTAAIKLLIRLNLYIIRYLLMPSAGAPPSPLPPPAPLGVAHHTEAMALPSEEVTESEVTPPPPPDEEWLAAEQEARASVALITLARRTARARGLDDGSLIVALVSMAEEQEA